MIRDCVEDLHLIRSLPDFGQGVFRTTLARAPHMLKYLPGAFPTVDDLESFTPWSSRAFPTLTEDIS